MAEDRPRSSPGDGAIFPQYRRTADGRHYYRIEAKDRFTEIQRVGNRRLIHHVTANVYPEMLRIAEMLDGSGGHYATIHEDEWDRVMDNE